MKKKALMLLSLLMIPTTVLADVMIPENEGMGAVSMLAIGVGVCAVVVAIIVIIRRSALIKGSEVPAFAGKPEEHDEENKEEKEVE